MRRPSHIHALAIASLIASSSLHGSLDAVPRRSSSPTPSMPHSPQRLTKAEKKRARKAVQRARLAARATVGEFDGR